MTSLPMILLKQFKRLDEFNKNIFNNSLIAYQRFLLKNNGNNDI